MIEFKNVSYTYANTQTPSVSDISFTVASGELKVVTGASGCGKTTLMRLANGLCPQIYGGRLEGSVTGGWIQCFRNAGGGFVGSDRYAVSRSRRAVFRAQRGR